MKAALLILFTSIYFTAGAQNGVLKKTWVSADHLLYAGTFDNIFFFETLAKKILLLIMD